MTAVFWVVLAGLVCLIPVGVAVYMVSNAFSPDEEDNPYSQSRTREGGMALIAGAAVAVVLAIVSAFIGWSLSTTGVHLDVAMRIMMFPWFFGGFFGYMGFLTYGLTRFIPYKDRTSTVGSNLVMFFTVGLGLLSLPAWFIALMWQMGKATVALF
ncbi:hypothetical protein KKC88_05430 [Patescibacteria group bacterium]|nr:hypothetical protein [Patescibacteria group bacterium]MBU1673062.1 hypothetical protein [Patescibacteria group bacterium]MBU1963668.1 hypothetical protein [Patescibacteria group bacterium]